MELLLEMMVAYLAQHKVITLVILAILFDLFIGLLLACKLKKVNSTIGIDGMIRKVGMLGCIVFLVFVDFLLGFNLIGWLPESILSMFEAIGMQVIGISDLFGLLFAAFEVLSIIKNWTLLGLPMFKGVNEWCINFLETFTDEMPTTHKNI